MTTLLCQNGWPVCAPHGQNGQKLHTFDVPAKNGDFRLTFHNGSVGFLLAHGAMRLSETVQDFTQFDSKARLIVDDWSIAIRPVRGKTTGYSNHAGYAFDWNATKHPLGKVGTFTPEQAAQIRRIIKSYDGVLRWGGDYHGRKDEMHVELNENVSMAEAERVARRMMNTPRGKRILAANPGQRKVILS